MSANDKLNLSIAMLAIILYIMLAVAVSVTMACK